MYIIYIYISSNFLATAFDIVFFDSHIYNMVNKSREGINNPSSFMT